MQPLEYESNECENQQITEIRDVVDQLDCRLADFSTYYSFSQINNSDTYYNNLIDEIILNLTIIPTNQEFLGKGVHDSTEGVTNGLNVMCERLSWFFHKSCDEVRDHLFEKMKNFPVDDVRNCRRLHLHNQLH
jgi:hypothetical protein